MNVFFKYTRQSLRKNKTRTLVTIIGIVLSMALLTAVIEGAYSGLQFLIHGEEYLNGGYHGVKLDMTREDAEKLRENREIADVNVWQQVGWAELDGIGESTTYLLIQDISDGASLASVHLKEGRMPENENELVLPEHVRDRIEADYRLGDTLELTVGLRRLNGEPVGQNEWFTPEEEYADPIEKTYTIVGFCARLSSDIEAYECPGYYALTQGGGRGSCTVLMSLKHPAKAYNTFAELGGPIQAHNYLLAFYGGIRGSSFKQVIFGFAVILVLLIAFGSISLIYNSFSISVSERTKQFGILKSVGATKKQIRASVLYEALVLSLIAIPIGLVVGCVGIGLTLYLLRDNFSVLLSGNSIMRLELNPGALLIAALVCLITTLISAWIPALRAVRITPMQAIRQSEDVKLTKRDVRTSKLTGKLFGFAGTMAAKNFRRNRRRYRSTVISLFLSVVLFIAASSFCAYLTEIVNTSLEEGTVDYDLWWGNIVLENADEAERRYERLMQTEHVTAGTYYATTGGEFLFDKDSVTQLAQDSPFSSVDSGTVQFETSVLFVRDADYETLCRQNGLDPKAYTNPENPMALLKNSVHSRFYDEDGVHFETFDLLKPVSLPLDTSYQRILYDIDGWQLQENDGEYYYYYAEDYLQELWNSGEDYVELDRSKARVLTRDEATISHNFRIGAVLTQLPYYVTDDNRPILIYPFSLQSRVLSEELQTQSIGNYVFRTDDHAMAYEQMQQTIRDMGMRTELLVDYAENAQSERMIVTIVNVFSYGFIILISLIAAANVFNTVSTSISLRRRELAMLGSIGLGRKDFYKMMDYECLIYGSRALLFGLPAAFLFTYGIYKVMSDAFERSFYVPWYSVAIAVGSVFAVVFASMLYAAGKLRKQNPIDAMKLETL